MQPLAAQPQETVIRMYAPRAAIYQRDVKGRYATLRWLCVWLTQLSFYGVPWLRWHGRQAVLFDLAERKFYLFGLVLWPQDFIFLAALLIICAMGLFLVTAVAGRVWCGYACPQTVYSEMFGWLERRIEGPRSTRMRRDRQPLGVATIARKLVKHGAWLLLAGWTGISFVGYFTPIDALLAGLASFTPGPWQTFWVLFYTLATYGNAGWLREQVCKYMCPYARFQSAMFDRDSLIVSYDARRGEPRGALGKAANTGDCIDCSLCVQVCPVGIDIRAGLQYECIGCAACADACNGVMDKVARPRGLVRYATERGLAEGWSARRMAARVLRPRVLIYSAVLTALTLALGLSLAWRTPLKLDVVRDRGAMGRLVGDGLVENVYRLQIMNTAEHAHAFGLSVQGLAGATVDGGGELLVAGASARTVAVRVRAPRASGAPGSHPIRLQLMARDDASVQVSERAVFFIPH
ncbi:MAG: ccoG [Massilia sp.]|nr:ccoG [Massilia sp.]